jgi:hypothetical protein
MVATVLEILAVTLLTLTLIVATLENCFGGGAQR